MRKKKGEELYFVTLTSSYLAYLGSYESKVSKKTDRPFIGVILKVENREYFAPLSSPKEKHKKMRETMDIIKIKNGKLGVINLNNMIPVLNHYKSMVKVNLSMLKKSDNINDKKYYLKYFGSQTKSIDENYNEYNVNSHEIRENPSKYWNYLPREVREHLIPIITICGGESSGKSIMIDKLANVFNTSSAWEYGREYVFEKLGGDEDALQYSDYEKIVFGHQSNVLYAARNANKFALIDTDYITTLAFCLTYEERDNPIVREFVQNYRFDLTILLENNVKWVNDGLRSIGDDDRREKFQKLL